MSYVLTNRIEREAKKRMDIMASEIANAIKEILKIHHIRNISSDGITLNYKTISEFSSGFVPQVIFNEKHFDLIHKKIQDRILDQLIAASKDIIIEGGDDKVR